MAFESLQKGSKGYKVKALQYVVGEKPDGKFGKATKKAVITYQKSHGLTADGICGKKTVAKIIEAAGTLTIKSTGRYVYMLERLLDTMKCDGVFSVDEEATVRNYQIAEDLTPTGKADAETLKRLWGLTQNQNIKPTAPAIPEPIAKNVKPVDYKQYDSRWGSIIYTRNNTYNKSQTIKSSGCGITSAAMVIATWWNKLITPKDTAAEAVKKGYRTKNSGTDSGYFKYFAKKYGASKYSATKSIEIAKSCIAAGGYVIVNVGKSIWTNGGHYILWWKLDDKDYVYINDPASAKAARAKNTLAKLKKATKGYYCIWE